MRVCVCAGVGEGCLLRTVHTIDTQLLFSLWMYRTACMEYVIQHVLCQSLCFSLHCKVISVKSNDSSRRRFQFPSTGFMIWAESQTGTFETEALEQSVKLSHHSVTTLITEDFDPGITLQNNWQQKIKANTTPPKGLVDILSRIVPLNTVLSLLYSSVVMFNELQVSSVVPQPVTFTSASLRDFLE